MKKIVIVGVSGGPDSMCLLDMLRISRKYTIIVCHVDYHQRQSSAYDKQLVEAYCNKFRLKLHTLDVFDKTTGNFQAFAREKRYQFFKQYYDFYGAMYLAIGHHIDDLIETYMLQQRRDSFLIAGMNFLSNVYEMRIIRPLLDMTKQDIISYLDKNKIEYGEDESNYSQKYERNRVRIQLSRLSQQERRLLAMRIIFMNNNIQRQLASLKPLIKEALLLKDYKQLSFKHKKYILALWFKQFNKQGSVSNSLIRQIDDVIKQGGQKHISVSKHLSIIKTYDTLIFENETQDDYCYTLETPMDIDTPIFNLSVINGGGEMLHFSEKQFPITIRNWRKTDKMCLPFGTKKVSRIFIDSKTPKYLRDNWPIICDCEENIIAIPGLIKNLGENSDIILFFMVK